MELRLTIEGLEAQASTDIFGCLIRVAAGVLSVEQMQQKTMEADLRLRAYRAAALNGNFHEFSSTPKCDPGKTETFLEAV